MTEDQGVTLGEIYRMCQATNMQLYALSTKVDRAVAPVSVLESQMADAKFDIGELQKDMRSVAQRSAYLSGGIAVLGVVARFLFPWHPGVQ